MHELWVLFTIVRGTGLSHGVESSTALDAMKSPRVAPKKHRKIGASLILGWLLTDHRVPQ